MKRTIAFAVGTVVLGMAGAAVARSTYPDYVPNAHNLDEKECFVCHTAATGGIDTLNGFGLLVQDSLTGFPPVPDWSQVYEQDSDLDGYSNGYELGDVEGTWTFGDPDPEVTATNPGDATSSPCGNGVIELDEVCDGDDLQGATCESLGQPANLAPPVCTNRCVIDPTPCITEPMPDPEPDMGSTQDPGTDIGPDPDETDGSGGGGGCSLQSSRAGSPALLVIAMLAVFFVWRSRR